MSKDLTITIDGAPEPRGPYVHARQHGALVYVTAQIGRDPKTGDFVKGGFEAEFNQAIDNVEAILKAAGSSLDSVVKAQIEFVDEADLDAMNRCRPGPALAPPSCGKAPGSRSTASRRSTRCPTRTAA